MTGEASCCGELCHLEDGTFTGVNQRTPDGYTVRCGMWDNPEPSPSEKPTITIANGVWVHEMMNQSLKHFIYKRAFP